MVGDGHAWTAEGLVLVLIRSGFGCPTFGVQLSRRPGYAISIIAYTGKSLRRTTGHGLASPAGYEAINGWHSFGFAALIQVEIRPAPPSQPAHR